MMSIKSELSKVNEKDIYSFLLFVLFKVKDIPEYSSISELAYALDKENLLNLCEYFGGTTIKVPTIDELQTLIYTLLLYQKVNIEDNNIDSTLKSFNISSDILHNVKMMYKSVCNVLSEYEFSI